MKMDIRRRVSSPDTTMGGVTVTTTAVETREIELQHLRGEEVVALGGMRLDAQYHGFTSESANLREGDIISDNSGTTKYEVVFVRSLYREHTEFFAKKVN